MAVNLSIKKSTAVDALAVTSPSPFSDRLLLSLYQAALRTRLCGRYAPETVITISKSGNRV